MTKDPCKRHPKTYTTREDAIKLVKYGGVVSKCKVCNRWIVTSKRYQAKKGSVKDLIKNWRQYARQNQ